MMDAGAEINAQGSLLESLLFKAGWSSFPNNVFNLRTAAKVLAGIADNQFARIKSPVV